MGTVSTAASMANFVITPCHQIAQCWAKVKSSQGIRQRLEAAMAEPQAAEQGSPSATLIPSSAKPSALLTPTLRSPC